MLDEPQLIPLQHPSPFMGSINHQLYPLKDQGKRKRIDDIREMSRAFEEKRRTPGSTQPKIQPKDMQDDREMGPSPEEKKQRSSDSLKPKETQPVPTFDTTTSLRTTAWVLALVDGPPGDVIDLTPDDEDSSKDMTSDGKTGQKDGKGTDSADRTAA
ncbi:uncharacterized protein PAC_18716 [Phialocephala subalpina]|uniref:Uncharacterized protein n=1 Tax=Phialocephala subalpina TaxID=576137 RepID=A0A1L7XUX0_9HELO|nr:uncharacterized protein PAC_18716 [Phialocephala subalpina]